jgi:hypothetical protein
MCAMRSSVSLTAIPKQSVTVLSPWGMGKKKLDDCIEKVHSLFALAKKRIVC